ncbi:MAG: GGDEF domain-containing protein [Deltaproteobacteria bacterium]|nr:GGDEF domain-containing protein [Deltaproteobacteria bacterium]
MLRLLVLVGALAAVAVLVLATLGIYQVYERHVVRSAEREAIGTANALLETERAILVNPAAGPESPVRLALAPVAIPRLAARLRPFLHSFGVVKIKVYSADDTIIFSTDLALIGRVDRGNRGLARALAGSIDSHLVTTGEMVDLAGEQRFDVDVVETYLPIHAPNGSIIGAFEVYTDITPYRADIRSGVLTSALLLGGILLVVFGASFVVVRRAGTRLKQAQAALEALAATDPLTGLLNRRRILERLDEELSRRARRPDSGPTPAPLSILLLDLDHFKQCNDTHGHLAGDEVLRETAARIARSIRRYDVVGRFGGEEFLVVLPGTGLSEALAVAGRVLQAVRESPVDAAAASIPITVSAGVAEVEPAEDRPETLLARADNGLYAAKRQGRDRAAGWTAEQAGTENSAAPR